MAGHISKFATTLTYNEPITASDITVEYDGHLYNVARDEFGGYGNEGLRRNPASEGLPFYIIYDYDQNYVFTSTTGQHTIEISVSESSVKTTKCFEKAVRSISSMILTLVLGVNGYVVRGATWQEAYDMLVNGAMVYLNDKGDLYPCTFYNSTEIDFGKTAIDGNSVVMYGYTWNSDGTVISGSATYPSE